MFPRGEARQFEKKTYMVPDYLGTCVLVCLSNQPSKNHPSFKLAGMGCEVSGVHHTARLDAGQKCHDPRYVQHMSNTLILKRLVLEFYHPSS